MGNNVDIKTKIEASIDGIVQEARDQAIKILKIFFKHVGLDPDLFEHIYSIEVKVEPDKRDLDGNLACAAYSTSKDIIEFGWEYAYDTILKGSFNGKTREQIINEFASTLVHEMLHANRTILIADSVNGTNIKSEFKRFFNKDKNRLKGYDIDLLDNKLGELCKKGVFDKYTLFVPVDIKVDKDDLITITAFNKMTGNYQVFRNIDKLYNMVKVINYTSSYDLYEQVAEALNKGEYTCVDTIEPLREPKRLFPSVASDYYLDTDKSSFLKSKSEEESEKIAVEEYEKAARSIIFSRGLEEALTEAFAEIAMFSRLSNDFDLNEYCDAVLSTHVHDEIDVALKVIRICGEDFVKWFLTSAYEEVNTDYLEKVFKEDYDTFKELMYVLYTIPADIPHQEELDAAMDIVNRVEKGR